jgi:hypothetical protein
MDWEYALAYRAPVGQRWDLETEVLVINDNWEKVETQTRCTPFFGCITGDFRTDYRYEQTVSTLIRGAYDLVPESAWHPRLLGGGGLVVTRLEAEAIPESRLTGIIVDAAVALERGGRSRWTVDAGYRVVGMGNPSGAQLDAGGWYVRTGIAFGF